MGRRERKPKNQRLESSVVQKVLEQNSDDEIDDENDSSCKMSATAPAATKTKTVTKTAATKTKTKTVTKTAATTTTKTKTVTKTAATTTTKIKHKRSKSYDSSHVYKKRRRQLKNIIPKSLRDMEHEYSVSTADEKTELSMPFCCALCRCSQEVRNKILHDAYIWPEDDRLPHRRCCHRVFFEDEVSSDEYDVNEKNSNNDDNKPNRIKYTTKEEISQWAAPYDVHAFDAVLHPQKAHDPPTHLDWVTFSEIQAAYRKAKDQESELYNSDGLPNPFEIPRTNQKYIDTVENVFEAIVSKVKNGQPKRKQKNRKRCVVLDCFAGIGTAIVVLKRLNIDISKIVHVEHDKVATHVFKENHDKGYNPNLPDDGGIKHFYIDKFEEFFGSYDSFCKQIGPIDLIIGGPPCVDFSRVNARREGVKSRQGKYMLDFASLIQKIQRFQHPHRLFYLVENVCLSGDDLVAVRNAFNIEWDPINLDAQYVSPTRRNRHFVTNISYRGIDLDFAGMESHVSPSSCLEKGFVLPAHLVDNNTTAKAQCLMGSASRIDERNSLRMYVFKKKCYRSENGEVRYHGRPLKVRERELLMGYPQGYVEKPVTALFHELNENALSHTRRADIQYDPQLPWTLCLPEKLHHFAGNYHRLPGRDAYRFYTQKTSSLEAQVRIKMAPPVAKLTSHPTHFTDEEYCKHLIGMAYSVPVVEFLLKPLQDLFLVREYPNFKYTYPWHNNSNNDFYINDSHQCSTGCQNDDDVPDVGHVGLVDDDGLFDSDSEHGDKNNDCVIDGVDDSHQFSTSNQDDADVADVADTGDVGSIHADGIFDSDRENGDEGSMRGKELASVGVSEKAACAKHPGYASLPNKNSDDQEPHATVNSVNAQKNPTISQVFFSNNDNGENDDYQKPPVVVSSVKVGKIRRVALAQRSSDEDSKPKERNPSMLHDAVANSHYDDDQKPSAVEIPVKLQRSSRRGQWKTPSATYCDI